MDRVTVSLDSLDDDVFAQMSGNRGSKDRVLKGGANKIAELKVAGVPLEIEDPAGGQSTNLLDVPPATE